ncbi:MAG: Smr/MutS family protein [Alphaproteobacteria bacterium]|nr:Smr/MutS family protein [Alphaproteobacteria bacterium]
MSEDDDMVWQEATADVRKLKLANRIQEKPQKKVRLKNETEEISVLKHFHHEPDLNTKADIDKQTLRRFKREEFGVEASLDLHGFTLDRAFEAVHRFIFSSFCQGKRAVLIVTGKGLPHPEQDIFEAKGVLKQSVPEWLKSEELSPMILTFIHPSAKLGGSGALYILLRRKRG